MSDEKKIVEIPEGTPTYTLPVIPLKPKPPEHTEMARQLAKRYLTVPMLEKMIQQKKESKEKRMQANKFKMPTTPEEHYERAEKYLDGAECAVAFREKSVYYKKAADMYAGAGDYLDAVQLAAKYAEAAEKVLKEGNERGYAQAMELQNKAVTADDWFDAARAFERIPGYLDADERAEKCEDKLHKLNSVKLPLVGGILLLIVALIFGAIQYTKTNAFHFQAAKVAYTLGMDSLASNLLDSLDGNENLEQKLTEVRYSNALDQMKTGRYSSAVKLLKSCGDYEDASELLKECSYYDGKEKLQTGEVKKAQQLLYQADGFEDADTYLLEADKALLAEAEVGKTVHFGSCECIVLDSVDGNYLLLSEKLYGKTECVTYHQERTAVNWENCSMREILNTAYMEEHFSPAEQAVLVKTETEAGVSDWVFLLSVDEYEKYVSAMGEKDALWWLRDNGDQPDCAAFVSDDGIVMESGYPVNSAAIQARPAFWVNMNQ